MEELFDIHSHILPGVDDGATDWTRAQEMLQHAYSQGIRHIIATPHYIPGHANTSVAEIKEKAAILQEYADTKKMDIKIFPGNEIFYSRDVYHLLESEEILTLAGSNAVMIEFSPAEEFRHMKNAFIELRSEGYQPILAHVERYRCLYEKKLTNARELCDIGVMLQVNTASVAGTNCHKYKKQADNLLRGAMVSFLGTDAHNVSERAPDFIKCSKRMARKIDGSYMEDICYANAEDLFHY